MSGNSSNSSGVPQEWESFSSAISRSFEWSALLCRLSNKAGLAVKISLQLLDRGHALQVDTNGLVADASRGTEKSFSGMKHFRGFFACRRVSTTFENADDNMPLFT